MAIITVTIPTVTNNRYQTEIRPATVTVRTSKSSQPSPNLRTYIALAREASTSGDRVAAENFYQHAEHYFRIMNAANEGQQHRAARPDAPADVETEMAKEEGSEMAGSVRASPSDRQPYSA